MRSGLLDHPLAVRWRTRPHRSLMAVTNRTSSTPRNGRVRRFGRRWLGHLLAVAPPCGGLPRRRPPGSVGQRFAAPVGRGEASQFATLTAREDEVAPGAGTLRAIAIRPQVALPARRALLTSASLTNAHLPTVT